MRAAIHQVIRRKGRDPIPLDPFYFPTAKQYEKVRSRIRGVKADRQVLRGHGMKPISTEVVPRPTPLGPTGLFGWLTTFARNTFFSSWPDEERDDLLREVVDICVPDAYWSDANPGTGFVGPDDAAQGESGWLVMYTRLRGTAVVADL